MDMDDCSKTSAGAVAALPDDLLLEILSRVPAKSICRFKCVSKAWRDLIADPDHCKKLRQAMQGLFVMTFAIPPETLERNYAFSMIDLTAGSVPLDVDDYPGFSFLTKRLEVHNLILMDSCNGLILFQHTEKQPDYVALGDIVCNPTTKQWACVPILESPDAFNYSFLAFDPAVSPHFHLIQIQMPLENPTLLAINAYSSETGTWGHNQIDSQEDQGLLAAGWHHHVTLSYANPRCAFVNGFLHLIVWDSDRCQILVVDVQGKARRMITVPGEPNNEGYLEQSQGSLHFMTKKTSDDAPGVIYKLSIWVLQDYDTQEWVLKNTVSSHEVFGELTDGIFDMAVVDIHQDRNIVFLINYDSGKLKAYNMDNMEVTAIATFEEERRIPITFARYVPCFSESPTLTS